MLLKCNDKTVSDLYKKLLALYPQVFREQLGESMQQTFKDLCNERREGTGAVSLSFVLGLFIETAIEMVKQHALVIARRDTMQKFFRTVGPAALISFVLVLPFAILETVNNTVTRQNLFGLILLFTVLWVLPTAFIVILTSLVRGIRAGNNRWQILLLFCREWLRWS